MSPSHRLGFARRNRGPLILLGMAFITLGLAIGLGLTLGNPSGASAATGQPVADSGAEVEVTEDGLAEDALTADQSGEIQAELEAALLARKASNPGELREHVHRARELAVEAGHDELAGKISNCRSGICYIAQVELSLRRAMEFLDEIPVVDATGSATSTT